MHPSPFTVAGMSASTSTHHPPTVRNAPSVSTSDNFQLPRPHYQPGYMMSTSQSIVSSSTPQLPDSSRVYYISQSSPQADQRLEDVPIVQTKAKMNHIISKGSRSDFGIDSMFESSAQRQAMIDEDAPPTTSIYDLSRENQGSSLVNIQQKGQYPITEGSLVTSTRQSRLFPPSGMLYIIVFGYPLDKYSVTVEYFRSLGETTEPTQSEVVNAFKIGYHDPAEAIRAVRKNGEVLGGTWMVGTKWADLAHAELLLGNPIARGTAPNSQLLHSSTDKQNSMSTDQLPSSPPSDSHSRSVGTPIKLAPASSAFRKVGPGDKAVSQQRSQEVTSIPANASLTPSKGMLGGVADLIFGW